MRATDRLNEIICGIYTTSLADFFSYRQKSMISHPHGRTFGRTLGFY
jgi:hypothetical protein